MAVKPNILLVDDDERLRIAAGKVLTSGGYRVASAASGREALDLLKQPGVELVISDLRLPDIDGIALLKQALELRPEIEVVMINRPEEEAKGAGELSIADCPDIAVGELDLGCAGL